MDDFTYKIERPQEDYYSSDMPSSESGDSQTTENACVSCLDDTMFPPRQKLPKGALTKLTAVARKLAFATLLANVVISSVAFFTSSDSDSMATFGFAFDSFFAVIASAVLLWRFWTVMLASDLVTRRENYATAIVALCLVVSSIAIIVRSVTCLYRTDKPGKPVELVVLTSVSVFAYSVLFVIKRTVAVKLGSGALMTDAMDSLCGALFAVSILATALVRQFTEKMWFLDSGIAIVVSVCSLAYGAIVIARLVCKRLKKERKEASAMEERPEERYDYEPLREKDFDSALEISWFHSRREPVETD